MLAKQAKELEKDRAKRAKEVARTAAALGVNGKAAAKRKNGAATAAGGGPVAKKGKFTGIQQKRNLSQAEQVAAMQMYQPYFGDAMNATNNVSSIFRACTGSIPAFFCRRSSTFIGSAHCRIQLERFECVANAGDERQERKSGNAGGTPHHPT